MNQQNSPDKLRQLTIMKRDTVMEKFEQERRSDQVEVFDGRDSS